MSFLWNEGIINPMINALLLLYDLLGNNFILALTVFTVTIRVLTLPLNLRQQRSMIKGQQYQPQIREIQKKYRDNPQKMQEEFQKLGYNPAEQLAGCFPLLLQMPILFGLYRAITLLLGSTPQSLFELTGRAYDSIDLTSLLPLSNQFLWLNLGQPDPLLVLPFLVFATMFLQQKLMSPTTAQNDKKKKGQQDDPTAAMTQSMQYTMPIMFGFFSLQFPAGLSIYFVLANIIGIGQGFYMRRAMESAKAQVASTKKPYELDDDKQSDEEFEKAIKESKKPPPKANKKKPSENGSSKSYGGSNSKQRQSKRKSKRKNRS